MNNYQSRYNCIVADLNAATSYDECCDIELELANLMYEIECSRNKDIPYYQYLWHLGINKSPDSYNIVDPIAKGNTFPDAP